MLKKSLLFSLSMIGVLFLFSCGQRSQDDRTPGGTFPGTRIPIEDSEGYMDSISRDTTSQDTVPVGSPIPIHR